MTAVAAIAALTAVAASSGVTAAGAATGRAKEVDLYVLTAQGGSLDAIPQHHHTFSLVLHRPRPEVELRRDQPEHDTHQELRTFIRDWNRQGFRRNPPTAAVVVPDAREDRDVQMVELRHPRLLEGGGVAFRAHTVKAVDHDALQEFEEHADARVENRFGEVSVFIDPTRPVDIIISFFNLPPVASTTRFAATFTNASFAAPGKQGYSVIAGAPLRVDLRNNQLVIWNPGDRFPADGQLSFTMTTQDPFIAGSVTNLPGGMFGDFFAGSDGPVPLTLGSFKLNL
jgi:hypothetical protein